MKECVVDFSCSNALLQNTKRHVWGMLMSVSIAQPFAEDIAIVAGSAFRGERCFLLQTDERAIVLSKTGAINSSHLRASAPAAKRPLVRHVINFVVTSRGTWQLVKCSRHVVWVGGVLCGFVTSQCSLRTCGFSRWSCQVYVHERRVALQCCVCSESVFVVWIPYSTL